MRTTALLLASAVALAACGDDASSSSSAGGGAGQGGGAGDGGGAGQGGSSAAPAHDLTGAVAYALAGDDAARLWRITASGEVAVAVDAEVQEFLPLRDGGVAVSLGNDVWVLREGAAPVYAADLGYGLRGQLADGRIVTYEGFLDPETGATEVLTSPLGDQVAVTEVSRNALRISVYVGSDSRAQVLDADTDRRVDIADCNNGEIVSLSTTRVLVDDCGDDGLLDLTTGTRSAAEVDSLTGEAIAVSDGAILLSQTCPGVGPDFGLCHVDPDGVATPITADGEAVAPLDYACCGERSRALATDGVDVVVLDGSGAAAYRVGQPGRRDVAVGKTLVQLSMGEGGEAFYIGASGSSPVLGVIHAAGDGSDDVLDDSRLWAEVRALPLD